MTTQTLYTLAAAPALSLIHAGVLEAMEFHGETPQYLAGVPIRFFGIEEVATCDHCGATMRIALNASETCHECGAIMSEDSALDLVEIDADSFLHAIAHRAPFTYERHTVRENGVSQIILTLNGGA
jgi:hypothetical protein